jgi:hypothetical protein
MAAAAAPRAARTGPCKTTPQMSTATKTNRRTRPGRCSTRSRQNRQPGVRRMCPGPPNGLGNHLVRTHSKYAKTMSTSRVDITNQLPRLSRVPTPSSRRRATMDVTNSGIPSEATYTRPPL